jgi:hypothetical protein
MKRGKIVQLLSNRAVTLSVDSRQNGLHLFGTTAGALLSAGFGELEFSFDQTGPAETSNVSVEVKSNSKLNEIKRAVCHTATARSAQPVISVSDQALPDAGRVFEQIHQKVTRTQKLQNQKIADRMRENLSEWIKGTLDAALAAKASQRVGVDCRRQY